MAASNPSNRLPACALILALLAAPAGAAELPTLDSGFTLLAESGTTDFRSDTVDLSGNVRLTQGPMSIEAEAAKAKNFRSDNSQWTFEKSVHIRTAEADLRSNSASAAWVKGQIANARVEGSPAQFEQLSGEAARQVRGRASVIEYDVGAGIIKLTNQVWFSNGKDEFRGDVVIYNVRDERLQINPGGQSGRVRGIIRPRDRAGDGAADAQQEAPALEESADEPHIANESGA